MLHYLRLYTKIPIKFLFYRCLQRQMFVIVIVPSRVAAFLGANLAIVCPPHHLAY